MFPCHRDKENDFTKRINSNPHACVYPFANLTYPLQNMILVPTMMGFAWPPLKTYPRHPDHSSPKSQHTLLPSLQHTPLPLPDLPYKTLPNPTFSHKLPESTPVTNNVLIPELNLEVS